MFLFSELPFCTSNTPLSNGEIFDIILNIQQLEDINSQILSNLSFVLTVQQDQVLVL